MAESTAPKAPRKPPGRKPEKVRRRSTGEGSVYPDADGTRWRGSVSWTEPDGTQRRRVVSAPTSTEARDKLDALRAELRIGSLAPAGPTTTVGEYLTSWIGRDQLRVRPATWRGRETHVRCYLVPTLGRLSLPRPSARSDEWREWRRSHAGTHDRSACSARSDGGRTGRRYRCPRAAVRRPMSG